MIKRAMLLAGATVLPMSAAVLAQPVAAPASAAASPDAATEDARLTAFLDAEFARDLAMRPQLATRLGMKEGKDRLDDNSEAAQLQRLEARRASVARMKASFVRDRLSPKGQTNFDIWATELERMELQYRFRAFQPPFYSFLYSAHSTLPDFLINTHTVSDAADLQAYNARIRGIPAALDTALAQTRQSEQAGVRVPRFQVERIIAGSRAIVSGAPFDGGADSPLMADARAKVGKLQAGGKITAAEAEALLADTRAALLAMQPGYARVVAWAEGALPAAPSGRVGAVSLPGGADWYAAALRINTTLDLTAAQIHQTGLAELQRIAGEQDALARSAGFADREAFYADRAKRFPPQPWTDALREDYLRRANAIIARNRTLLPARFNALPQYRMEVLREPSFSEVAGGAAHASGPSPDGVRPGRVYDHLLGVTKDPAELTDLMCHEGVPGHVMQGDIQARQTGTPKFRLVGGYVAFNEGWALYAELLCKEMGAYQDAAEDFMRLDAETFRAARLVVDTGIHAMGWTEDQAVEFMIKTGRLPPNQARSEVRRYITMPGQATGYKIGMIKIMELRRKAEAALGDRFDIKAFDDLLISDGSQPLGILERRVDQWIAARKAA
ncbi:DUF885 domain-containing protein [Novosphingobium flavum]|uniref:DUF885 domain-containing protein n=1 Tax=Novosphingobium aerophilum TaxID=2839843 RepID=A0A7X1F9C5_9SPHN|nr:DUF885 domain-containing protein [Novosphingobium aerophilum]MBC2652756.1 DUF885 domain-containing protein [Novosphingobium aerophilum]MBC2662908.1 DUF885 domain-containing protein [Novosphingobium aerophilum]